MINLKILEMTDEEYAEHRIKEKQEDLIIKYSIVIMVIGFFLMAIFNGNSHL